jgi:hypothetical protein
MDGTPTVTLARAERSDDAAPVGNDVDLTLRPLSSWAPSLEVARGIAQGEDARTRGGRHIWILVAKVPADRILATSATGLGSPYDSEWSSPAATLATAAG